MLVISPTPDTYDEQFTQKQQSLAELLAPFDAPEIEGFASPPSHYRLRAEFKIWHQEGRCHYAVFPNGGKDGPTFVEEFPVASTTINTAMPQLLAAINDSELLKRKLFQCEFLSTLSGELLITLVYHKPLDNTWLAAIDELRQQLNPEWQIIGRSRKQKLLCERDYVNETLQVNDRAYHYRQMEGCFSQPNGAVCEQMLGWAVAVSRELGGDLLELYCGNGNFTVPLAQNFRQVLATEISKNLVATAEQNFHNNQLENARCVRMAAEEISAAIKGEREFRRLAHIDLESYDFSTVFVDPPRAGLDDKTVAMVQGYEHILYISCNPLTLCENLQVLSDTHKIERAAFFDQFPYTHHAECGVLLRRK